MPFAEVTVFGGLEPDGEVHKRCRLTMIGNPTDAVLFVSDFERTRWRPVDRLTQATVTDHDDGTFAIEGISDELVNVVGMPPGNATARWEVRPKVCRDCR